ncbi:hypothetical protein ACFL4G_09965 [Thermodesulfobacteriota bacterium]
MIIQAQCCVPSISTNREFLGRLKDRGISGPGKTAPTGSED